MSSQKLPLHCDATQHGPFVIAGSSIKRVTIMMFVHISNLSSRPPLLRFYISFQSCRLIKMTKSIVTTIFLTINYNHALTKAHSLLSPVDYL